jgi:hypothetical protein
MSSTYREYRPTSLSGIEASNPTGNVRFLPTAFDETVLTNGEYTPPLSSRFSRYSPRDLLQHSSLHGIQIEKSPWFLTWGLWVITVLWCLITLSYAHNAALSNPDEHLIPANSEWTIGILNFMSTGSAFLLTALVSTVLNRMRWVLATQPEGVKFKNFIGMSPATNTAGVLGLLFSNRDKSDTKWLFQRWVP